MGKKLVIAGVSTAILGTGAVLAINLLPNPHGTSGVDAFKQKVTNAVQGNVDITGRLPPQLVQLIENDNTNKDLLNALDGINSCLASGQNTPGASAADQQNFKTLAPLIDTVRFIVQQKGIVSASQLSQLNTLSQNKAQYETAFSQLFTSLKQGDASAINCVDAFTANNQAVDALGKLAAASSSPIFKDLGFTPAQQTGFLNAVDFLEGQPLHTDFIQAVTAAQTGVTAAQASPQATAADQADLATAAKLLTTVKAVAQDHGHLTPADTAAVQEIIQNAPAYGHALTDLYNGYRAHDPALVTLADTFKAQDSAGIALIQTFAQRASANLPPASTLRHNANQLGLNILSPKNAAALKNLGISGKTQAAARSYLNRLNS